MPAPDSTQSQNGGAPSVTVAPQGTALPVAPREAPAPPSEAAPKPVSAIASILGIFAKPKATFEALARSPRILVPMLLVVVLQFGFGYAVIRSGAVLNDTIAKLEAKGESPETIARVEKIFATPVTMVLSVLGGALVLAFALLVGAALMFFMGNLMLRATLTFRHYLCIACYSAVVGIADQVVRTVLAIKQETMDLHLGVGAFLGDDIGTLGKLVDTMTDPLLLWATAISALGVSVFAKKSFGFGVATVLPGFLLSIALSGMR